MARRASSDERKRGGKRTESRTKSGHPVAPGVGLFPSTPWRALVRKMKRVYRGPCASASTRARTHGAIISVFAANAREGATPRGGKKNSTGPDRGISFFILRGRRRRRTICFAARARAPAKTPGGCLPSWPTAARRKDDDGDDRS